MTYWTVARTECQRENLANHHLARQGFVSYLPRIKLKNGRISPLYTGYLFVQDDQQWYPIQTTIGIRRLLLNGSSPAKIREEVIASIRQREGRDGLVLDSELIRRRGTVVRVISGLFRGQTGTYEGKGNQQLERILLDLLGRKVCTDIPNNCIEDA